MSCYHTHSTSFPLTTRFPRNPPKRDTGQLGVFTEMITCVPTSRLPVRLSHVRRYGGAMHRHS